MDQEHTVLPRSAGHRPGGAAAARLVRAVRAERLAVFDAVARGATVGRRRSACVADGRRSGGGVHGSYTDIPGASGKAEGVARGLGGVFVSEGDRVVQYR